MTERPPDVLDAIDQRTSVRRYQHTSLSSAELDAVRHLCQSAIPLVPGNRVEMISHSVTPGEDLTAKLGGYGLIVTPPHYLVMYGVGQSHVQEDIGYRAEQVVVSLVQMDLGSCFIGCLSREQRVRALYDLPGDAHVVAFLVFGRPAVNSGDRAINGLLRTLVGATRKQPAERLFYEGDFDRPSHPPAELSPLIEAARRSPSAANAQPWRFLWRDKTLYAFVQNRSRGLQALGKYRRHDGGIALANITLVLQSQGADCSWTLLAPNARGVPDHPGNLEPLASIRLP